MRVVGMRASFLLVFSLYRKKHGGIRKLTSVVWEQKRGALYKAPFHSLPCQLLGLEAYKESVKLIAAS